MHRTLTLCLDDGRFREFCLARRDDRVPFRQIATQSPDLLFRRQRFRHPASLSDSRLGYQNRLPPKRRFLHSDNNFWPYRPSRGTLGRVDGIPVMHF